MKKINLLYLAVIPLVFVLFQMNANFKKSSVFFYGFAENKETELSHDKPVLVQKIWVTPGQEVKKGQLLMEVSQSSVDLKITSAGYDLERLKIAAGQEKQAIRDRITQLKAKRKLRVAELEAQIKELEASLRFNQSLLEDLNTIDSEESNQQNSPANLKLKTLRENLKLEIEPIDIEIAQLEEELEDVVTPSQAQREKLKQEIEYFKSEKERQAILAPSDGLIGNILCQEGENISAFSKLINFYERNPTLVKGYVHESLILQVSVGDTLLVSSSLHPSQQVLGIVSGLGSRIVEIPERLRKIPENKNYGREVLIRIPPNNPFLQKEKVMLNSPTEDTSISRAIMISLFNQ